MGANATDLKLTIHPHPTLSETLMESAEVFFGQATTSIAEAGLITVTLRSRHDG